MTEVHTRVGKRHHFPCDCGGWHYLLVVDDDDPDWRFLEIADTYAPQRWGERVGAVWEMLRGRPHCHRGVILDAANVRDLLEVLTRMEEWDSREGREGGRG